MAGSADSLLLALLALAVFGAVLVFLRIQLYLADPRRREYNEQWFAQFEAHLRARYRDRELQWRTQALDGHFQNSRSGRPGGGGWHGFIGPRL